MQAAVRSAASKDDAATRSLPADVVDSGCVLEGRSVVEERDHAMGVGDARRSLQNRRVHVVCVSAVYGAALGKIR